MKNLQLSLKQKWFEMTKAGIKTEDYREISPYWCNRLVLVNEQKKSKTWWAKNYGHPDFIDWLISNIELKAFCFVDLEKNKMTLGYPKSTDRERILELNHKGIEIRTGNPEWGAESDKLYFIIKHGKKL